MDYAGGGLAAHNYGLQHDGCGKDTLPQSGKNGSPEREARGFFRSFIVGVTFSLGWTPCIGPVLASILLIASAGGSAFAGVRLLALYSLGLAVPFFVAALLVSRLMGLMQRFGRVVRYISPVLGGLLIAIGILLLSGYWRVINSMLET